METTEEKQKLPAEVNKALKKFDDAKKQAEEYAKKINEIEITDDTSRKASYDLISDANKAAKFVDDVRTEIKKPYFEIGKAIDNAAKLITDPLNKAVAGGKVKLKEWDDAETKRKKDEQEAADKLKADEEANLQKDAEAKQKKLDFFTKVENWAKGQLIKAINPETCVAFGNSLNNYLTEEFKVKMGEFNTSFEVMINSYKGILKLRHEMYSKATELTEDEKQMISEAIILEEEINEKRAKVTELRNKMEISKLAKQQEVLNTTKEEAPIALIPTSSPKRKTWKFELVDKTKVALDFLMLDEAKVKEYMSTHKDKMKDGDIINGIKYFIEESVVLR